MWHVDIFCPPPVVAQFHHSGGQKNSVISWHSKEIQRMNGLKCGMLMLRPHSLQVTVPDLTVL